MERNRLRPALFGGLLFACVLVWTAWCPAATYYVRTDGGTASQCTGLSDAPYPGSGDNQACAWSQPFWALDASGNWKIQGGDTLLIHPGSYRMGFGAPNTGWCDAAGAYECHLPPLPSGPDPSHPTRILGVGWEQGCADPPELWGAERAWQILSLAGTSNAVIGCLEITDHSGCVEGHPDPAIHCERGMDPFGDWAPVGIYAADSSHVVLSHLNIHGLAWAGVHAGRLSDWTVENVRIAGNGGVGWDGDIGESANTGNLIFRKFTVEWNGCGETYPLGEPYGCWAQTAGGYGDGVGLGTTGGDWFFEDAIFRYNTSDGLDMLYVRLPPSSIQVRRTEAYGNAGDQIKVNGPTRIENSLMLSQCGFFEGKPFTYHVDNCRAGGSALALNVRRGNQVSVINSTIVGQGDCLCLIECDSGDCDGSETFILQNNIFMGYPEFWDPSDRACYIWFEPAVFGTVNTDYNLVFNAKIANVGLAVHDLDQDPLVVNSNLETFDGHLQAGSPAINSGLPVRSLGGLVPGHDLEGNARPAGSGVDRGAYEYGGGLPSQVPAPGIQANGSEGSVTLSSFEALSVSIALDPGEQGGDPADWWIVASSPFGWYSYNVMGGSWNWGPGLSVTYQGPLLSVPRAGVLNLPRTIPGSYVFYFGVDTGVNGSVDLDQLYYDSVQVDVR